MSQPRPYTCLLSHFVVTNLRTACPIVTTEMKLIIIINVKYPSCRHPWTATEVAWPAHQTVCIAGAQRGSGCAKKNRNALKLGIIITKHHLATLSNVATNASNDSLQWAASPSPLSQQTYLAETAGRARSVCTAFALRANCGARGYVSTAAVPEDNSDQPLLLTHPLGVSSSAINLCYHSARL